MLCCNCRRGKSNINCGDHGFIGAGVENIICTNFSTAPHVLVGGSCNKLIAYATNFIGGGSTNKIDLLGFSTTGNVLVGGSSKYHNW